MIASSSQAASIVEPSSSASRRRLPIWDEPREDIPDSQEASGSYRPSQFVSSTVETGATTQNSAISTEAELEAVAFTETQIRSSSTDLGHFTQTSDNTYRPSQSQPSRPINQLTIFEEDSVSTAGSDRAAGISELDWQPEGQNLDILSEEGTSQRIASSSAARPHTPGFGQRPRSGSNSAVIQSQTQASIAVGECSHSRQEPSTYPSQPTKAPHSNFGIEEEAGHRVRDSSSADLAVRSINPATEDLPNRADQHSSRSDAGSVSRSPFVSNVVEQERSSEGHLGPKNLKAGESELHVTSIGLVSASFIP